MARRKPSRVILSSRVAQKQPVRSARGSPFRGRSDSPFGGMNSTHANIRESRRTRAAKETEALDNTSTSFSESSRRAPRQANDRAIASRRGGARGPKHSSTSRKPTEFKALKMQRALAAVPYSQRTQTKNAIANLEQFNELSLLPTIRDSISAEVLKGLDNVTPTPIQRLAIVELLAGTAQAVSGKTKMKQYLLAAETGSGKTLAYLLPLLDAIKRAEAREHAASTQKTDLAAALEHRRANKFDVEPPPLSNDDQSTVGKPRAIILVPSAELVDQVGAVAKSLSHTVKFRAAMLSANYSGTVIRNRLFARPGVDLIVTTPHLLSSIINNNPSVVSRVSHIVIDEADSLFDRSFAPITGEILDRATPSLKQLVLCSATIPKSLDTLLHNKYPDMIRLTTPKLHSIPRRVQMTVVDAVKDPYQGSKDLACADTIWQLGREDSEAQQADNDDTPASATKYILVFVNTREQTAPLAEYLVRKGVQAVALDRDALERKQGGALAAFTTSAVPGERSTVADDGGAEAVDGLEEMMARQTVEESRPRPTPHLKAEAARHHRILPRVKVLVTTDIASRGIDTTPVKNVILYDVPHSTVDFIHRLGRVGRMGRRGRAVVIVGKGDRRDVVKEVRQGMFAGTALV